MEQVFNRFLQSRKHISDKDDDGNAVIARVGSISGYRTACQHYIWNCEDSERDGVVPPAWNNNFYEFFKGLKNT